MNAKVLTTSSWKGGTGKTTLNVLTAETLAKRGKKVLIIDLDSNCSISACYEALFKDHTSKDFISGQQWEVYPAKGNIDIIPADLQIGLLNNIMDSQLKIILRKSGLLEKYDYVIIDPPGYWGPHTRNAIFAADVLVVSGTCSRLDFEATNNYFDMLQQCCIEADTYVVVNAFSLKTNGPGVYEKYREKFADYLIPEPLPYIQSLKKLTANINYELHPSVKVRLEKYVDYILGGENA